MLTTGILMDGKISVGVRRSTNGVRSRISSEATTKVKGRRRASKTIHIISDLGFVVERCANHSRGIAFGGYLAFSTARRIRLCFFARDSQKLSVFFFRAYQRRA